MKSKNNYLKKLFAIFVALSLVCSMMIFTKVRSNIAESTNELKVNHDLISHESISIWSDSDFAEFPGLGTQGDPYIIEGYEIITDSYSGIYVSSVSKFFIIRNCYIDSKHFGIQILDVESGRAIIANNTCTGGTEGIKVFRSESTTIFNNTCTNYKEGISVYSSSWASISNNILSNNNYGIYILYSQETQIRYNTFSNCGLHIGDSSVVNYLSMNIEHNIVNGKEIVFFIGLKDTYFDNSTYEQLILIDCSNITITNLTLNRVTTGVFLFECSNISILNTTCSDNQYGFYVSSCYNTSFKNNSLISNVKGIYLITSDFSFMDNNTITENEFGIYQQNSGYSVVSNNSFFNCGLFLEDFFLEDYISNSIVNNSVNNKMLGYFENQDSLTISDQLYGQLIFVNCSKVSVLNQNLSNSTIGLQLFYCPRTVVINSSSCNNVHGILSEQSPNSVYNDNICSYNIRRGISVQDSTNCTLSNNTNNFNSHGIYIIDSPDCYVTENQLNNNLVGIYCLDSNNLNFDTNYCENSSSSGFGALLVNNDHIIIANNLCINYSTGILVTDSEDITIMNNNCSFNSYKGISSSESSNLLVHNNTCNDNRFGINTRLVDSSIISNNTVIHNNYSMFLDSTNYCLIVFNYVAEGEEYGISLLASNFNTIHHNAFVNNGLLDNSQARDSGIGNVWYDTLTLEGNYWNNWDGSGGYSIFGSSNSIDPYPLYSYGGLPIISEYNNTISVLPVVLMLLWIIHVIPQRLSKSKKNKGNGSK